MTTNRGPTGLVRNRRGSERATLLELFFDLAFVAALAATSMSLVGHVSWSGLVDTVLPLSAIWWVWSITALVTDFYDPRRLPIQLMLAAVMFGTILMAAALPRVFDGRGLLFAVAYVSIHVGRGIALVSNLRGHPAQSRAARFLFWFGVSALPWIIGALEHGATQRLLWGLALLIDLVAAGLRYPTPRLGRVPLGQYQRAGEHLGERYQQFMILAMGDPILVAVLRYSESDLSVAHTLAFLAAFAMTVLFWQVYVYRAGALLRGAVRERPSRILRWAPYTHLVMVVGIVVTAAGFELVLRRPGGETPVGWVVTIVGGPALFLIGRTAFERAAFGRLSLTRVVWMIVLVGTAPLLTALPPVLVAAVVLAIMLGVAILDVIRYPVTYPELKSQRLEDL